MAEATEMPGPAMPSNPFSATSKRPDSINSPPPPTNAILRLPPELRQYALRTDETLLKLSMLLNTAAGLDNFLSTINYTCYLLAFLHTRLPSRARLVAILPHLLYSQSAKSTPPSSLSTSPLHTLATHLSTTRATLRLTALLPLYTALRNLLKSPPQDPILYALTLTQTISYVGFQVLENIAHLTDLRVLPPSSLFRTNRAPGKFPVGADTSRIWLLSCRLWLLGVSLDFPLLFRRAQLEVLRRRPTSSGHRKVASEEAEVWDRKWWRELFVAGCWWPLCVHWSIDGGVKGVGDGVIGLLGGMAGWECLMGMWEGIQL